MKKFGSISRARRGLVSAVGTGTFALGLAFLSNVARADPNVQIVGFEADATSMEAARALGLHNNRMVLQIFDSLVMFFGDTSELKPGLAVSWNISEDNLEYTFKLREGIKFHDGTDFNAEAVKFTFDRMLKDDHPYHDNIFPFAGFYYGNISSVDVIDNLTVKFVLSAPQATFLTMLVHVSGGIVSPTAVAKQSPDFGDNPVGTGPYKFVLWDRGQRIILEANKDYWAGAPKIATLIFKPVTDPTARLGQLKSGEVDLMVAFPPEFIPAIEADENLVLLQQTGNHTWWVALNTEEPPFNDVRVRQAVNYAIDKKAIIEDVLYGAATLSTSFALPGTVWYEPEVTTYPYNPEKAKELLAEAGYPNGFETDFLVPESGSGMIAPVALATVMQAYLADVGVKANIITQEWNSYLNTLQAGLSAAKAGMAEMSWMRDTADPEIYAPFNLACDTALGFFNLGRYCNAAVDKAFEQAKNMTDNKVRVQLYRDAQKIVTEEAPWIFMFHANQTVAARVEVKNVVLNPSFLVRFENIEKK